MAVTGQFPAFAWSQASGTQVLAGGSTGWFAPAISDNGMMVSGNGWSFSRWQLTMEAGGLRVTRLAGTALNLDGAVPTSIQARAVNNNGWVVGSAAFPGQPLTGFVCRPGLDTTWLAGFEPMCVIDAGIVAGHRAGQATSWTGTAGFADLGVLGAATQARHLQGEG